MTTERNPDVLISAWLDEGPSELPDETRRAITTATRTIPQQRRGFGPPWRISLLNGYARLALAAAAIVVVALGGLYLLGPGQRSVGGPPASPTPSPSLSVAPSIDTGTIILRNGGCTWEGNPGHIQSPGYSLSLRIRNETDHYGSFFLHRMRHPHTYEDGAAYVADLQQRLATGEEWPENTVSYPVSDFDVEARQTSNWYAALQPIQPGSPDPSGDGRVAEASRTFAVVCSANTSATGDILSIFSVGPLEVTASETN